MKPPTHLPIQSHLKRKIISLYRMYEIKGRQETKKPILVYNYYATLEGNFSSSGGKGC